MALTSSAMSPKSPGPWRVAVMVGGPSGEHAISLASGAEALRHLDRGRYSPFVIRVGQDARWTFPESDLVSGDGPSMAVQDGIVELVRRAPDIVFPIMHGPYGEDGHVQALLDLLGLPYVGSGPDASSLAMNKARTRDVYRANGLPVARGEELRRGDVGQIRPPCVVKPLRLGSSVGLDIVHTMEAYDRALATAFEHDDRVLIESFVTGEELTAGVLEDLDGVPHALPLVAIRPKDRPFFDLHAKYTPGATDEICPAPFPTALTERLQALALAAHKILGCRALSRTDMIIGRDGEPILLETNTIPGLTKTSLLPQAAAAAGLGYPALLDRLLQRALIR